MGEAGAIMRLLALLGHLDAPRDDEAEMRVRDHLARGEQILVAVGGTGPVAPLLGVATLHVMPVVHRAGPIGRVTSLVVAEEARGKGIGRALVRAAESRLAERGCTTVEVTSNRSRGDAHRFYESIGYERTSYRFARVLAAEPQ